MSFITYRHEAKMLHRVQHDTDGILSKAKDIILKENEREIKIILSD